MEFVFTANHKGHHVTFACPDFHNPTQECFDQYPLEFIEDKSMEVYGTDANAPKDSNYPNRGYVNPTASHTMMRFKLPEGLTGDLVLLQWRYITGNSCRSPGYDDYNYPPGWNPPNMAACPEVLSPIGVGAPEQFWNCIEVKILPSGSPNATPAPTPTPTTPSPTPPSQSPPSSTPPATMAPTKMPTNAPPAGSGCCSLNYKDCDAPWCGTTETECNDCNSEVYWLPNGAQIGCSAKWSECTNDVNSCCFPSICAGDQWYKQCVDGQINPPPSPPPTPFPTSLPPPTEPTTSPPTSSGTCGGGFVGNGVCPDGNCCSEWGWCGITDEHCNGPTPPSPTPPSPSPPSSGGLYDNRMIAYMGNWQACPTPQQVAAYTHIVIAFAVSYTWSPGKNICSETCDIATPPVCNNALNQHLIQDWQNAGKKVLLSFGGAGMGGSWDGNNDCWEYCFGREEQVIDRVSEIVIDMGLDGVDIDYEYYYEDGQNNSPFSKGAEAQHFLTEITVGLKDRLGPESIITHAPMDSDVVVGTGYYNVLKEVSWALDFLMPQYYNGVIRPLNDGFGPNSPGINHFNAIIDDMFDSDPTKIVFGFCISDCSGTGTNTGASQAVSILGDLEESHECHGGAFFWVVDHDMNGVWSNTVGNAMVSNVGCNDVGGYRIIETDVDASENVDSVSCKSKGCRFRNHIFRKLLYRFL